MKKTINTNAIVFAQAQDNNKAVIANRYVVHALYEKNKALVDELGGTIIKGVGGFRAEFKTVANAKKFIAQAYTELSEKEYNATRKTSDKAKTNGKSKAKGNDKPKTQAKGNDKMITLTDAEGNEYRVPASALQAKGNKKTTRKGKGNAAPTQSATNKQSKKTAKKGKGNAELTDAGKSALERMKASVLNRAASAYSVANGGEATTFKALGKTAKQLSAYLPKAKADLLKSDKWAKASKTHGLTAEMLG